MIGPLAQILGPAEARKLRTYLVWLVISAVCNGVAATALVPIAAALVEQDTARAWRWLAALAVAVVTAGIAHYVQAMRGFRVALVILRTLQRRVGDHIVSLPLGWFDHDRTGRLSRIVTHGVLSLASLPAHLLAPLVGAVVTPLTVAVCLLVVDWRLGAAALACAPVLVVAFRFAARLVERGDRAVDRAAVRVGDRVVEYARCQPTLRAYGRAQQPYAPLEEALEAYQHAHRRSVLVSVPGILVSGFAVQLAFSVLIVTGAVLALGGRVDVATLIAALVLAARFTGPLAEAGDLMGAVRMARAHLARAEDVLNEKPLEAPDRDRATPAGGLAFDGVSFAYDDDTPILDGISFTAEPGSVTAIVGPSGVGKTTLARLAARFYDVTAGTVRLGGVDVRELTADTLAGHVSLVFQDVYLFAGTIEDNVRLGRPDADEAELRRAVQLAGVEEIAQRLRRGLATQVGEGGVALSTGERQRISIARAILKQAPVIVLDEATSALDVANEHLIRTAIAELRTTSTVLVIAHRLSTIAAADQIIMLEPGPAGAVIAEQGTHTDLLPRGGRYAHFWDQRRRATRWRLATTT